MQFLQTFYYVNLIVKLINTLIYIQMNLKRLSLKTVPIIKDRLFLMEVPVVKWLSSQDMDTATQVQILDLTDCISHSTNTLGKGMNPIILPPAMGK